MRRGSRALFVFLVLVVLLVVLAFVAPSFYQRQPLLSLAAREAPTLLEVGGMTLIIILRHVDISIGSQFAVCGVGAGLLAAEGYPSPVVACGAVAIGILLGAINGVLVAALRLPSIVVTLATMVTWREGLRLIRQGEFVNLPDSFEWFGLSQMSGQLALIGFALLVLIAQGLAMRHISAGRVVYAVGSDEEAARLAGLHPRICTFVAFVLMGALSGAAAMMNIVQSPQVDPKMGTGLELKTIAAVVVGGVAISGGRGTVWGAFAGFLLLGCISPALVHLHIQAYWEKAIQGAVILIAIVADSLREKTKGAGR
jgi:rhamnose transport system permease protein